MVSAAVEPTDEDCDWPSDEEVEDNEDEELAVSFASLGLFILILKILLPHFPPGSTGSTSTFFHSTTYTTYREITFDALLLGYQFVETPWCQSHCCCYQHDVLTNMKTLYMYGSDCSKFFGGSSGTFLCTLVYA